MDSNNGSDDEFSDAVDYTMAPIKLECPIQDCTGGTDGEKWSCEAINQSIYISTVVYT